MGTGTKVDWEIIHGVYELLPNEALGKVMYVRSQQVGAKLRNDSAQSQPRGKWHRLVPSSSSKRT